MMDPEKVNEYFSKIIKTELDVSAGVAAIRTLMEVIRQSESETVQELEANLKEAIMIMKNSNFPVAAITSGCELFLRFITLVGMDTVGSFSECKQIMLNRGTLFLKKLGEARSKIVKNASKFILDGSKVLTHSRSRVVLQTLREAHSQCKIFEVYVTISAPDNSGKQMCKDLLKQGIPCTLILDSAVGYIMEQIDFIMVGAEGVMESGGIVNKVGSYTLAVCANEMKKPFYVLTESFKFSRLFPLNQQDLPVEYKYLSKTRQEFNNLKTAHPLVDYTPPFYITLLFTDIGILTPSAVSDELIKLYL
ncbi:translation initiation factor eIF-2B subunit alpha isoform X2 [Cylas formicarius]|uniref:translation initiation factor eIF-2B subunit alpha isoform X2 n=1 Tax=Cylas formicarius TaxID=197179 RepID=UPI002958C0F5|nr:translation initiation factor eIF-2B subunit alpha isoform X2 [Cylas formicarius]